MELDLRFESNRQRKQFLRSPGLFIIKKMRGSEVNVKKLSSDLQELFGRAKSKETSSSTAAIGPVEPNGEKLSQQLDPEGQASPRRHRSAAHQRFS